MIYELRKNIDSEIEMLGEISNYFYRLDYASPTEKALLVGALNSLTQSMKIVNNSIPEILQGIGFAQRLPLAQAKKEIPKKIEKVEAKRTQSGMTVFISRKNKKRFLQELDIGENYIKRLKKKRRIKKEEFEEF